MKRERKEFSPAKILVAALSALLLSLSITNLETGELLGALVVGIEPEGVTISPDGRWVYVTAETSNTVSVIDTKTNQVITTLLVGARTLPSRVVIFLTGQQSCFPHGHRLNGNFCPGRDRSDVYDRVPSGLTWKHACHEHAPDYRPL